MAEAESTFHPSVPWSPTPEAETSSPCRDAGPRPIHRSEAPGKQTGSDSPQARRRHDGFTYATRMPCEVQEQNQIVSKSRPLTPTQPTHKAKRKGKCAKDKETTKKTNIHPK